MSGYTMRLFAAGIGNLIEVILLLVVVGVAAINKILAARREETDRRLPRRAEQPVRGGVNQMEPKDVDEFLDEVLGRGAAARPRVPPQQKPPVVILRPTSPPPVPQARTRPETRHPVAPRPSRPARIGQVQPVPQAEPRARSKFSQSVQKDVDQAAAATQGAATTQGSVALGNIGAQSEAAARSNLIVNDVFALLRSPNEVRRAILLREILGPPVSLRRRKG